jgi:hypothetical protein
VIPDREKLEQLLKDRQRIESLNVPADVRGAMLDLHDGARLSTLRQREPVKLQVAVDGLPNGRYRVSINRVDASSGNTYASRGKLDEQTLQHARQAGRDAARDYLAQRWSQPEMGKLKGLLDSGPMAGLVDRIRSLPPERQRDARAALELFQNVRLRPVKEFNSATRPLEQNVAEVSVSGGTFTWNTTVAPYGVLLVEARRID